MNQQPGKEVPTPPKGSGKEWVEELRAPFLTASFIPVLVGGAAAWAAVGVLDLWLFLVTMVGVMLLHLGANVTNDYWDYVGGTDVVNRFRTPFSGGSTFLVEGRLSPRKVLRLGQGFIVAGSLVGLYLVYAMGEDGWVVLLLGLIGVGGGYFYSAPPLSLASRGWGDLVIGALFGLLAVLGTYFIQTTTFTLEAVVASLPVSLWIAAVIWINQIPDIEADGSTGKRTMVVRLGIERSIDMYSAIQVSAVAIIVGGVILNLLPLEALLAVAVIVPTMSAIAILRRSKGLYPEVVPAQGMTIITHLVGGLLLSAGLVLGA
ncbi:MAG: prenyltransferase [Thermoplasmata archaeon]|nr:MAG: prenyltransferase [Thermoplasmata archaeon]